MPDMEFPPGIPDDVQEYLKNQIDHHEMSVNVQRHEVIRFLEELSVDQMQQLASILGLLEDHPERIPYFLGFLSASLQYRHGRCSACGKNHEEQLSEISES